VRAAWLALDRDGVHRVDILEQITLCGRVLRLVRAVLTAIGENGPAQPLVTVWQPSGESAPAPMFTPYAHSWLAPGASGTV